MTGKVDTEAIKITAARTDTTTKHRITSQVISENKRRETPRSLSYMNCLILFQQILVNHFSDNMTWPCN